jgi:hypothetical protein
MTPQHNRSDDLHARIQPDIQEMVSYQGFAIRQVFDSRNRRPEWAYTVGLHSPGTSQPELFVSGLTRLLRTRWLLELGFLMKGPPSLAARHAEARARGCKLDGLSFPPGGMVFQTGRRYQLAQSDLPGCFGLVEQRYYANYFGQAIAYHGNADFPVLQFIWSDKHARFPWESGYDPLFRNRQDLLFNPQQYLPLKEWDEE